MNFITYKENETVDNNANYFLMEITSKQPKNNSFSSNFSELEIFVGNFLLIDQMNANDANFPLFCFENGSAQNVEELNLNSLKKFSHDCSGKYILVSLKNSSIQAKMYTNNKKFNDWHNSNTEVKLNFVNGVDDKYVGKILKIFHKHYQPTISE